MTFSGSIAFVSAFALLFLLSPTLRKEAKATVIWMALSWREFFTPFLREYFTLRSPPKSLELLNEFSALVEKYDVESPYVTAFLDAHKENEVFIQLAGKAEQLQKAVDLRKLKSGTQGMP